MFMNQAFQPRNDGGLLDARAECVCCHSSPGPVRWQPVWRRGPHSPSGIDPGSDPDAGRSRGLAQLDPKQFRDRIRHVDPLPSLSESTKGRLDHPASQRLVGQSASADLPSSGQDLDRRPQPQPGHLLQPKQVLAGVLGRCFRSMLSSWPS